MLWARFLFLQCMTKNDEIGEVLRIILQSDDVKYSTTQVCIPCCNIDLAYVEEHWQDIKIYYIDVDIVGGNKTKTKS